MQEAARKVLLENTLLRALLAETGVSAVKVEAFLRTCDQDASSTASLPDPGAVDMAITHSQAPKSVNNQEPSDVHTLDANDPPSSEAPPPARLKEIGYDIASQTGDDSDMIGSSHDIELSQLCEVSRRDLEHERSLPDILGPVSDCFCPEVDVVPGHAHNSDVECSTAANILASFRGHGDVEQARDELGCLDNAKCSITSATLLHTLDSEHTRATQACSTPLR